MVLTSLSDWILELPDRHGLTSVLGMGVRAFGLHGRVSGSSCAGVGKREPLTSMSTSRITPPRGHGEASGNSSMGVGRSEPLNSISLSDHIAKVARARANKEGEH